MGEGEVRATDGMSTGSNEHVSESKMPKSLSYTYFLISLSVPLLRFMDVEMGNPEVRCLDLWMLKWEIWK